MYLTKFCMFLPGGGGGACPRAGTELAEGWDVGGASANS